jgi:hypothetical protein
LNGFKFIINEKYFSLYNNNIYYGSDIYINDLYIFDLEMLMFNINSKINRLDNQYSSYLWNCWLGHINQIKITKLHEEGCFDPSDYTSYKTCEACLLEKMKKKNFTRKSKRINELC